MNATGILGLSILLGVVAMPSLAAAQVILNLNRPNAAQQLQLPNWQNQQRRENFQLQQQFNREIDRSKTLNNRNQPDVPVIVPNCRPSTTGSLSGNSCR